MTVDSRIFDSHFDDVAAHYRNVRFTDHEPIHFIRNHIRGAEPMQGVELGCGTGRYSVELLQTLPGLHLHCVDTSTAMLEELDRRLKQDYAGRFESVQGRSEEVHFEPGSIDAVFSFNALHHFNLPHTLRRIALWLRPEGRTFLYTRTPTQNAMTLWGQYFPDFAERENRLKTAAQLREAIDAAPGLRWVEEKRFEFIRRADLLTVLKKVDHFHYSTFRLYSGDELETARQRFIKRLKRDFPDPRRIQWTDYNLMVVLEKR